MIRFFISPHPTFGNYKKPIKWKVEASPYFWWWYALTLNEDYKKLCEQKASGETVLAETAEQEKQLQIYEDFGDVHYKVVASLLLRVGGQNVLTHLRQGESTCLRNPTLVVL